MLWGGDRVITRSEHRNSRDKTRAGSPCYEAFVAGRLRDGKTRAQNQDNPGMECVKRRVLRADIGMAGEYRRTRPKRGS